MGLRYKILHSIKYFEFFHWISQKQFHLWRKSSLNLSFIFLNLYCFKRRKATIYTPGCRLNEHHSYWGWTVDIRNHICWLFKFSSKWYNCLHMKNHRNLDSLGWKGHTSPNLLEPWSLFNFQQICTWVFENSSFIC